MNTIKMKLITAIAVLLLMVASLLVSGCTTSSDNTATNQTPSSTATHDALLEKFLTTYKNLEYANKSKQYTAWELEWTNSTSARLQDSQIIKNTTYGDDSTYMVFPTSQDATKYLNAMNKTAYSIDTTNYRDSPNAVAYQNATGKAPQTFKRYVWNEGNPFNISEYKNHQILQTDNLIVLYTGKILR
jgi:hypothetical protein